MAEVVENQVDGLIITRDNRGRPAITHYQTPHNKARSSKRNRSPRPTFHLTCETCHAAGLKKMTLC